MSARDHGHHHDHGQNHEGHGHEHDPGSREFFDAAAAEWDDDPAHRERAEVVGAKIAARLPLTRATRLLDYGAGTGQLGRMLAAKVGPVTLADASAGMTQVSQARITAEGSDMRAIHLDLLTDPVPTDRYDLVVSLMALHHVGDVPAVLRALRQLTEGWVAIADLDTEDGTFHGEGFTGPRGFSRESIAAHLTAAGFGEVTVEDATTLTKDLPDGPRDYTVFLATARAV